MQDIKLIHVLPGFFAQAHDFSLVTLYEKYAFVIYHSGLTSAFLFIIIIPRFSHYPFESSSAFPISFASFSHLRCLSSFHPYLLSQSLLSSFQPSSSNSIFLTMPPPSLSAANRNPSLSILRSHLSSAFSSPNRRNLALSMESPPLLFFRALMWPKKTIPRSQLYRLTFKKLVQLKDK